MSRPVLWLALALGAGAILAISALIGTPFGHSQHFNRAWVYAFGDVFWQGTPFPRHLPGLWDGLGGLDLFFYPPLGFWVTELFGRPLCPGCGEDRVLALGGGACLILSGVAFYASARLALGAKGAIAGALIYMVLPYHLWIEWFHRQALAEFAAYIAVPALLFGFLAVLRGRGGAMLALGWAGLLLSHLPSALLAGHILGVLALIWIVWQLCLGQRAMLLGQVLRGTAATAVGFGLTAVYWLPAVTLIGDVSPEMLYSPIYDPERWLFLDGVEAPVPAFHALLIATLMANGVAVLAVAWLAQDRRAMLLMALMPMALIALAMSALARPLWMGWIIELAQFPWRLLLFADFAVAAAFTLALRSRPWGSWPIAARLLPMVALIGATALALPESVARVQQSDDLGDQRPGIGGATEYVPPPMLATTAADRFSQHREIELALLALAARVQSDPSIVQGRLSHRRFVADPTKTETDVTLALPYWRHWQAPPGIRLSPDPETGLTRAIGSIDSDPMILTLPWHWSEWVGLAAMLAGLAGFVILVIRRPDPLAAGTEDRI